MKEASAPRALANGQIWKENDKRVTRYVTIVQTLIGGRRVRIRGCTKNGAEIKGAPTTETDVLRFGNGRATGFKYISG